MIDRYGRKINYLRVSVTARCNLRCIYCMLEEGVPKNSHEEILRNEQILKIVRLFAKLGIKKVRFTGGEPLVRKGIEDIIYQTSKIEGIEDIALTTNGILLYDFADTLKKARLKRVNISLDTLKEERFRTIARYGELRDVLKAIEKSLEIGFNPVKINTVLIKGINDDEVMDFVKLADEYPIHVRFIELMPIGIAEKFKDRYVSTEELLKLIPDLEHVKDSLDSTAKVYKRPRSKGTVGFITPLSRKFCTCCNRIRLTTDGHLKPCLHSKEEIDLKPFLDDENKLEEILKYAISMKPLEHNLEKKLSQSAKMMFQIGG